MNVHASEGARGREQLSEAEMHKEIQESQMKANFKTLLDAQLSASLIEDAEKMKSDIQETIAGKRAEIVKEALERLSDEEKKDADEVLGELLQEKIELAQEAVLQEMALSQWDDSMSRVIHLETHSGYSSDQLKAMTSRDALNDKWNQSLDFFLHRAVIDVKEANGPVEERMIRATQRQAKIFLQAMLEEKPYAGKGTTTVQIAA